MATEYLNPDRELLEALLAALEIAPDDPDYDPDHDPETDPIVHRVSEDRATYDRQRLQVAWALAMWIPRSLRNAEAEDPADAPWGGYVETIFASGAVCQALVAQARPREAGR